MTNILIKMSQNISYYFYIILQFLKLYFRINVLLCECINLSIFIDMSTVSKNFIGASKISNNFVVGKLSIIPKLLQQIGLLSNCNIY